MDLMLLQGGLGNQLFQWAFSLNQKTTGKRDLKYSTLLLDLKLPQITKREYCLKDLIPAEKFESKFKSALKLLQSKTGNKYQITREINNTNSQNKDKSLIYIGFFQELSTVENVKTQILESFNESRHFKNCLTEAQDKFIAIHVRKGDYLGHSKTREFHGLTSNKFYVDSALQLRDQTEVEKIRLFSDSQKDNNELVNDLRSKNFKVENMESSEFLDFQGICQASAVVMSNSSFSWWGSYIADHLRKAPVIYPTPWFKDVIMDPDSLFPKHWIPKVRSVE
jgi:hypothetical protein